MHHFLPCPPVPAEQGGAVVVLLTPNAVAQTQEGTLPFLPELPENAEFYQIGHLNGTRCCAACFPEDADLPEGVHWQDSRSALLNFSPAERIAAGRAKTLLFWQKRRKFCGVCGSELAPQSDECARRCSECGAQFFPVLAPAMIVAVHRGDELLLATNARFKPGMYSILAGFVEAGESVEEAIAREVREEVGIEVTNIRYFGSQSWPYPNSLMLGFEADYASGELKPDGTEILDARWCKADHLPQTPGPGSIAHELIAAFCRKHGC